MGNIFSSWMGDDEQTQNSTLTDVIVNNGTSSNLSEVVVNKGVASNSNSNSSTSTNTSSTSLFGGAAKKKARKPSKKSNKKNQEKLGPINRIKKDAELLKKKVKKLKK